MDRTALIELAERCEKATGPDRWEDCNIHEAVTSFNARRAGVGWPDEDEYVVPAFPGWKVLPAYTSSLDAATTLIPEGCLRMVRTLWDDTGIAGHANVTAYYTDQTGARFWQNEWAGTAKTEALALCAAALRALASTPPSKDPRHDR